MNDFEYQLRFVCDAAWRMVEMQDRNPLSPSYGCFNYAYWRDKTSEFADARFQEAGAALGLLSLQRFDAARGPDGLPPAPVLYRSFSAALRFWAASQHPEGCWDEWYKGERGLAATEFTMIAYGLAARHMGERIEPADRARLTETMRRAARWLAPRHDRVKANHEAAAAAALALAWEVTGEDAFRDAAREKIADTLVRQTDEGWFPEVGGMDLGYCSVLLDYVMLYVEVTGDDGPLAAMRRLVAFMSPHVHPDATISPEAGLCLNPYVSRLGFCLLAARNEAGAAAAVATLETAGPGRAALSAFLADDLRLLRWSYLPVVTEIVRGAAPAAAGATLADAFPEGWTVRDRAAVAAFHGDGLHVYFSIAGGGAVRVYTGGALVYEDLGVDVVAAGGSWGSSGYAADRKAVRSEGGIGFAAPMGRAAFFYPGFLSRLVLRLGSTTPLTSRLLRQAIDRYRLRKGTAINQSAAPIAGGGGDYRFERHVTAGAGEVVVSDRIVSARGALVPEALRFNILVSQAVPDLPQEAWRADTVRIVKRLGVAGGDIRFSAEVKPE